jgi:hypothetical protein
MIAYLFPLLVTSWQHATSLGHVGYLPQQKRFSYVNNVYKMAIYHHRYLYKCELTISRTIVENSGGVATSWLAPIVYPLIILTSILTCCIDCWIFNSMIFLSYLDNDFHYKVLTTKQRLKDFSNSYPSFLFLHSFFLVVCSYIEFDKLKILMSCTNNHN